MSIFKLQHEGIVSNCGNKQIYSNYGEKYTYSNYTWEQLFIQSAAMRHVYFNCDS